MKKLLVALVFCAAPLLAQECVEVIVRPVVSMATIDSIRTINGSKIIEMRGPAGNRFGDVSIGDYVWGKGIPWGTTVVDTVTTDSLLTLSKVVTFTDTTGTTILGRAILNFGFYDSTDYTNGDFVGMSFAIPYSAQKKLLVAVTIIDSSDQADSLDIVILNSPEYAVTPALDTSAATFVETAQDNILGIVKMRTMTDLGVIRLIQETNLNIPLGSEVLYGRLISRKTVGWHLTSTSSLLLRFKLY